MACTPAQSPTPAQVEVSIHADGLTFQVNLMPGSTVQEALNSIDITLGNLDRVEPPSYSVLEDKSQITVTRIWEEFEVEQSDIPFEQKRLPTELLPEGVEQFDPLQKGAPGLRETTYRIVFEDGEEVSRSQIKSVVIQEPQPQIILFGTQQKHTPFNIPGKLYYLSQGNLLMFDGNTADRIPILNSGDLDGRILSLSDDKEWLLFTRHDDSEDVINSLWAVGLNDPELQIDLQISNVIHFASWVPGSNSRIIYSTVEPREAAPGWQANNDLQVRNFSLNGWVSKPEVIIDTNSGGIYGWWGISFRYSPDYNFLAYAGPDQIGTVNLEEGLLEQVLAITPLQTRSDWAWVPGINWSPNNQVLFTVQHSAPPGSTSPEESQEFDLTSVLIGNQQPISMVSKVGMFAYPMASPIQVQNSGEEGYQVAYLQAVFPTQSDTSRYRLVVMDRDGSNPKELFPPKEGQGIEPNQNWGQWSPTILENSGHYAIAVLYQGNIWMIDSITGQAWQVTGDGLVNRILWH